jgi:Flp pilus assembly protein TadB
MANEQPQRRVWDQERRRWTDERLDDLADLVRAFAPTVTMVATHQANIDELRSDIVDFKRAMVDVEVRLCRRIDEEAKAQADFRREYRRHREEDAQAGKQEQATRTGGRWTLWAAAVGGIAVVLASLITALVTLLGGSG